MIRRYYHGIVYQMVHNKEKAAMAIVRVRDNDRDRLFGQSLENLPSVNLNARYQ